MAFCRSLIRLKDRLDIHPALKKVWSCELILLTLINLIFSQLWKKHYEVNGLVVQHLSPFEQNIVSPMFNNVYSKVLHKLSWNMLLLLTALINCWTFHLELRKIIKSSMITLRKIRMVKKLQHKYINEIRNIFWHLRIFL